MNDFNRTIFTDKRSKTDTFVDICFAIIIGFALAMGALAYFDVLTK